MRRVRAGWRDTSQFAPGVPEGHDHWNQPRITSSCSLPFTRTSFLLHLPSSQVSVAPFHLFLYTFLLYATITIPHFPSPPCPFHIASLPIPYHLPAPFPSCIFPDPPPFPPSPASPVRPRPLGGEQQRPRDGLWFDLVSAGCAVGASVRGRRGSVG